MKPFRIVSLVVAVVLTLAGCANTVRGIGKDVNNTADAVEDSVN
jgi:predicted small secreted protein